LNLGDDRALALAATICANTTMSKVTHPRARATARTKGQQIVDGLRALAATLEAGEPAESRFTVRTYTIPRRGHAAAETCTACVTCWR
jgi:hypothetical protein